MARVALIVIDMQKAYFQDPVLDKQKDTIMESCNRLIAAARLHNIPVWNVVTEHAKDSSTWSLNMKDDDQGFLFRGNEDTEAVEGLDVHDSRVIVKTRDSAFHHTSLASELHESGVTTLVLCGVSTQSCVMQTAADAYAHDFRVVLAREAIATNNPQFHESTLALLRSEYRQTVADNKEILRLVDGTKYE